MNDIYRGARSAQGRTACSGRVRGGLTGCLTRPAHLGAHICVAVWKSPVVCGQAGGLSAVFSAESFPAARPEAAGGRRQRHRRSSLIRRSLSALHKRKDPSALTDVYGRIGFVFICIFFKLKTERVFRGSEEGSSGVSWHAAARASFTALGGWVAREQPGVEHHQTAAENIKTSRLY